MPFRIEEDDFQGRSEWLSGWKQAVFRMGVNAFQDENE